uniref:Cytochrome b n=1 Tax=Glomeridesmus spelaeus TaxID=2071608 RepID=A0A2I7MLB4_9MYRI|nr:cytochrome b [Glomeridesmus spelaeus]
MNFPLRKKNSMIKIINFSLIDLPSPINISYMWNFGSLLGLCLMIQIISGLFLTMHYTPNSELAFDSINHIIRDTNNGWLIRSIHANTASFFFIMMYFHMARGIFYSSFKLHHVWLSGISIFFITMMTAFLGYVLPWGQMSFWGATVITNMISTIPYMGNDIVQWIWGGFSVNNPTLNRFFAFHFMFPFIIIFLVMIHLLFLHITGSNNPLGTNSNIDKIPFHPYFSFKDSLTMILMILFISIFSLIYPLALSDPENFILANPMMTPPHIQPEWYFLFMYAILRAIPNKLGGVIALLLSIMILLTLLMNKSKFNSNKFYPMSKILFWILLITVSLLTWTGARPVEPPFIMLSQIFTLLYFSFLFYFLYQNQFKMI